MLMNTRIILYYVDMDTHWKKFSFGNKAQILLKLRQSKPSD